MNTCEICGKSLEDFDEKGATNKERIEALEAIEGRMQELLDNPVKTRNVLKLLIQACECYRSELKNR